MLKKLNQLIMNSFSDYLSDFYQYLGKSGEVNSHTRTNYISWLQFLSAYYTIDDTLDATKIQDILSQEDNRRTSRDIYKTRKDITNFGSALKKFLFFLSTDIQSANEQTDVLEIRKIESDEKMSITEKETIISSRVGQGLFRKKLICYWKGCSVCNMQKLDILVASHIKPWRESNNSERLDMFNGLLLLPNYDKLFDRGYISFDTQGRMIYSKFITDEEKFLLGINDTIKLRRFEDEHKKYLKYHNDYCFMG